jgi:hypothetical protein
VCWSASSSEAWPSRPASRASRLLWHLASQASLVMRNAQLTAELRASIEELLASRRRLVEAQDAERRKIERNLHDGDARGPASGLAALAGRHRLPPAGHPPRLRGARPRGECHG